MVYGTSRLVTNRKQVRPVGGHALAQLAARFAQWNRRHDPVEPAIQIGQVVLQRGVLQRLSSSPDRDGAQQQPPERDTESGIAALHSIARIAQRMRQTHLPFDGVAALSVNRR